METTAEMNVLEKSRLLDLEAQIETDKKAFYRIGMALVEIRGSRLYRERYATFEDYCRDRWELSIRYADKLMLTVKTMDVLQNTPMGVLPSNERQVRPLTKLSTPEAQQEAWEMAVESAPDGKLTARHVAKVVAEIKRENTQKAVGRLEKKTREAANTASAIDEDFKQAFDAFYWEVQRARMEKWEKTSREVALFLIKRAKDLIELT